MGESDVETETGSMLMLKYESCPEFHCSRKLRNINNFRRHMQSISENLDPSYFDEPMSKSTFQQILEDPEKLEFVHSFFKLSEEDQNKMISNMGTLNGKIVIKNGSHTLIDTGDYELIDDVKDTEIDGFCFVYQPSVRKHRSFYAKTGLSCLSKTYIKFLQRQHSLNIFEDIENQLRTKFQENYKNRWQADDFSGYERYITHIIAKYLGLVSESFNGHDTRVIRVSNHSHNFLPPKAFLYQEMESNIHVY